MSYQQYVPYTPDAGRYDGRMPYRRCGRSGLKLPAISLGLWHNFGDITPFGVQQGILRAAFDCGITHFDFNRVLNDTEKVIEEHKTFGCRYIGLGSMPGGASKYAKFRDNPKLIPAVDKIAAAGMKFMYHNHSGEYETLMKDGRPVMFHLSEDFTPAQMGFTLDTYWVKYGGFDVVPEIERLAGRLPVIHFKDMFLTEDGEKKMSWVGGGNVLDFEKIVEAFLKAGTEFGYVEQDNCNGEDPFLCLKKSYDYLTSLGLK